MVKRVIIYTVVFLFMSTQLLISKTIKVDSLENQLRAHPENDTLKVILLNKIAYHSYKKDIDKTYRYAREACQISDSLNYLSGKAEALKIQGIYFDIRSDYPKAVEFYQNALNIFEELNDKKGVSACYHNIGVVYKLMGDYEKALHYYGKSLAMEKELGNTTGISISYYTMANIYVKQSNYSKALEFYNKALQLFRELGNEGEEAACLNNIGNVYVIQNKTKKAEEFFRQSLEISQTAGEKFVVVPNYISLGNLYFDSDKPQKAYNFGTRAYAMAKHLGAIELLKESAELLAKSSSALGRFEEAYQHYVVFKTMSDSLLNEDRIRKVTALEYQFRFEREKHAIMMEQQKKEAISREKEKRQKTVQTGLLIGTLLLLLFIGIILYAFMQKRKANRVLKKQKKEIEEKNIALVKLNEEINMQTRSLKQLNATKDKFFSIIAHDLKSPFSSVFGLTESLLEDHVSMDIAQRQLFIERLYDSSKQIYRLLENLLTWARIQREGMTLNKERFSICGLINGIKTLLQESIKRKNLTLKINSSDECEIEADKNMIETVIRNLLSNAVKFTPNGGEITISTEIRKAPKNSGLLFTIHDNGVGIPPEAKDKLFTLTENVSTTGTEQEAGSGLGLILCKEFIEMHGGKIWAESEPGKGSTFYFTIPEL